MYIQFCMCVFLQSIYTYACTVDIIYSNLNYIQVRWNSLRWNLYPRRPCIRQAFSKIDWLCQPRRSWKSAFLTGNGCFCILSSSGYSRPYLDGKRDLFQPSFPTGQLSHSRNHRHVIVRHLVGGNRASSIYGHPQPSESGRGSWLFI